MKRVKAGCILQTLLFSQKEDCALIAHGGTIMAIMEAHARPQGNYFDFQTGNGEGFILREDGSYEPLSG